MSDAPLYQVSRSSAATRRLWRNIALSLLSLAVLLFVTMTDGAHWLTNIGLVFVGLVLALQLKVLVTSPTPLSLFPDRMVIASSFKIKVSQAFLPSKKLR